MISAQFCRTGRALLLVVITQFMICNLSGTTNENETYSSGADTILIASEPDYPPFCMIDEEGNATGFSVDLFKAAAEAAGIVPEIKIGIWSKIKQDLADGKIDALPLVGRTLEREPLYEFTMPYLSLHGAVFVRKNATGIASLSDLKDKEILVMKGDNAEEYVRREAVSQKIITTKTYEEAFQLLEQGHHDAVITQRIVGIKIIDQLKLRSVKQLDMQLPEFVQDFCFATTKGDTALIARLNEGLSVIIANQTYEQIRNQWFGPQLDREIRMKEMMRRLMFFLVPFMLIMTLIWVILLRREVKKRTLRLQEEVTHHKNTFSELKWQKEKLEDSEEKLQRHRETLEEQVAERTRELDDKVAVLNRSQQAMLYMIEDLNSVTAELKSERRKLELSNKELEAFTYSVSHDLRAPLRAINGFSRFLVEDYGPELDDEGRRYIHTIRESALKMDMLITDLLSLSRVSRSQLRFSKVQLEELILSVYNEVASEQEQKEFILEIGKMPAIYCDPGLMKQVWQNLIDNALKYSSKSEKKKIVIGVENKKGTHTFFIKDSGGGFDNKYVHKLFGLFQRLHQQDEFEGNGVGLAIVQRIIERHGGTIRGEGMPGKGASFFITLPVDKKEIKAAQKE